MAQTDALRPYQPAAPTQLGEDRRYLRNELDKLSASTSSIRDVMQGLETSLNTDTANIATNTANISTNTANISTNTVHLAAQTLTPAQQVQVRTNIGAGPHDGDIIITFDAVPLSGYVELDGSTIVGGAATYPNVAARYPWMVSAGNIILPDLRGKFLRSWAHGSANDPDRASRTARVGDAATGDKVGTNQADGFKSHTHPFAYNDMANGSGIGGDGGSGTQGTLAFATNTGASGGNETRPININVMYQMKMG